MKASDNETVKKEEKTPPQLPNSQDEMAPERLSGPSSRAISGLAEVDQSSLIVSALATVRL